MSYQLGGGWPAASQGLGVSGADSPCRVGMFALPLLFPMALSCLCSGAGGGGHGEGAAGGKGGCTANPAVPQMWENGVILHSLGKLRCACL